MSTLAHIRKDCLDMHRLIRELHVPAANMSEARQDYETLKRDALALRRELLNRQLQKTLDHYQAAESED